MNPIVVNVTFTVLALPVLFAITLHEAAHGYAADLLGDDGLRQAERMVDETSPWMVVRNGVALPCHPTMTLEDCAYLYEVLEDFLALHQYRAKG